MIFTKNIALLIEQSVNIIDSLNQGIRLTTEEQEYLCIHFIREEIKKNEFPIQIGDYENHLYFIEKGILRYWSLCNDNDSDKEVTFWFSFPGEFANSYLSLKEMKPSLINIQAITDSIIWKISKLDLVELYRNSLNINKIARVVLEDALTRKVNREIQLLGMSCEEIYANLIAKDKELIKQIPLKYLASYIGVTPQTLSCIRRKTK